MKKIVLFLFITTSVCKIVAQQEELDSWVLNLEEEIKNYEKRAKVKTKNLDTLSPLKIKTVWYKKKKKISKIKILYYFLNKHPAEYTYYFKNDYLIKHTISGVLPKPTNSEKKNSRFYIFDDSIYFKNKEKVIKKIKRQVIKDENAFYASYVELLKLNYNVKKLDAIESKNEYERVYKLVGGLRIY